MEKRLIPSKLQLMERSLTKFNYRINKSGWVALRIFPSSHSNPVFVKVNNQPVIEKKSAEWCLAALEQCWKMKEPNIRAEERKQRLRLMIRRER
jgi:hypothetical protein